MFHYVKLPVFNKYLKVSRFLDAPSALAIVRLRIMPPLEKKTCFLCELGRRLYIEPQILTVSA